MRSPHISWDRIWPIPGIRERFALAVDFSGIEGSNAIPTCVDEMEPKANTEFLLFVYGSLLDPSHRTEILGHAVEGVPAVLHGYARGRSRYRYIRRKAGAQTEGLVLTALGANDFVTLDGYEEVPTLYTREQIEVVGIDGALIRCWAYLPTDWGEPATE
jgi:hypothetical protein